MDKQPAGLLIMFKLFSLPVLFLLSWTASAFQLPADHQATYRLEKMDTTIGQVTTRLKKQAGQIEYTSSTKPKGIIALVMSDTVEETSKLEWPEQASTPRLLSYSLFKNKKYSRNQNIQLDWKDDASVAITASYKNRPHDLQHEGVLWGRQTLQLALISELLSGNKQNNFNYTVVDKGALHQYQCQRLGSEKLELEDRFYNTVKFKVSRDGSNRSTLIWFAAELEYLPVYVEKRKGDEVNVSMSLKSYQALTK